MEDWGQREMEREWGDGEEDAIMKLHVGYFSFSVWK